MADEEKSTQETPIVDGTDQTKQAAEEKKAPEPSEKSIEDTFYGDDEEKKPEDQKPEDKPPEDDKKEEEPKEDEKPVEEGDDKKEEEKKEDDDSAKEGDDGAPEKYELEMPQESLLGDDHVKDVEKFAREHKMSNKQAQQLLDRDAKITENFLKSQVEDHQIRVDDWKKEIEADPEYGGDKYNDTVVLAKSAVDKFGSQAFKDLLKNSGYGNHPEVVKIFAEIGREIQSDTFVHRNTLSAPKDRPIEDIFYGDSQST